MTSAPSQSLQIFAPAKVNLFLHVTGKRNDGFHLLDSLITFADIGDIIDLTPSEGFTFDIQGPFAGSFSNAEKSPLPDSKNLLVKAARMLARHTNNAPSFSIVLHKNIPLGAGLGGGSADAAAILWGLCRYWKITPDMNTLKDMMMQLGADVPVCFESQTRFIAGAGEKLGDTVSIPELYAVLIHPAKRCDTKTIFKTYNKPFASPVDRVTGFSDQNACLAFLKTTQNMLLTSAVKHVPEIQNCLAQLEDSQGCLIARMSGSGSSCFGIYDNQEDTKAAQKTLQETNPDWWVKSTTLGQVERY